jgi:predicted transcriptional regulator
MSYSYANLLRAYSPGHIRLLKAISQEGCVKEILSGTFISKHKLRAASSVSSALKKLIDNELVYETANGYIIYDRLMNEYLCAQPF